MSRKEHFGITFLKKNDAWKQYVKNAVKDNDFMHIVDEATQEYFENIHQMLTDGFKDKCWKMI